MIHTSDNEYVYTLRTSLTPDLEDSPSLDLVPFEILQLSKRSIVGKGENADSFISHNVSKMLIFYGH